MSVSSAFFKISEVIFAGGGSAAAKACQLKIIDPGEVYRWCIANHIDTTPFWGRANRVTLAYVGWNPQPSYLLVEGRTAKKISEELAGASYKPEAARIQVRVICQPSEPLSYGQFPVATVENHDDVLYITDRYVTSCINIAPHHSSQDGPYLLELHDHRYFFNKKYCGYDGTTNDLKVRQYNILIPGSTAYPVDPIGATTSWQTMYNNAWAELNRTYATSTLSGPTLPTITEEGMNLCQASNPIELMKYIEQLHSITSCYNLSGSLNTAVNFNDGLGDATITALDSVPQRTLYKMTSKGNDYYEDWPEFFYVSFQNRFAPLMSYDRIAAEHETVKTSTVTLPSTSLVPSALMDNRAIHIWSPVFSELRPTSATNNPTPSNDADMATLADTYRDRFISRVTTAHQNIHYIIRGLFLPDASGTGDLITSRLHEIFVRDYGDGDGFVTELKGGKHVLNRLLGEPFSMLSKPLWTFPGIGWARDPLKINPTTGLGQCTNPTANSSVTVTLIQGTAGAESTTSMSFSMYYIGATFVGTKRVFCFPNPTTASGSGYYAV